MFFTWNPPVFGSEIILHINAIIRIGAVPLVLEIPA